MAHPTGIPAGVRRLKTALGRSEIPQVPNSVAQDIECSLPTGACVGIAPFGLENANAERVRFVPPAGHVP